ncbi:MAG: carboxypeptidase regulatory-like domain-containing protein [Pseudobutyrivibrio sp.]|nr:carboxypeptidase regulatory-like domain-containing protein [Pseudobutyrivibrio sp.]
MKKYLKSMLLMAVAIVSATMFVACGDDDDEPKKEDTTYLVAGKVVSKFNEQPIADVTVTFTLQSDKSVTYTTKTAADGTYKFDKVKLGKYDFLLKKEKYSSASVEVSIKDNIDDFISHISKDPAAYLPATSELVDLGLSVKWASCNLGADAPEKTGTFYAWGELASKEDYSKETCLYYEKEMADISGNPDYDAAAKLSNGKMRMPTQKEMTELLEKCEGVDCKYKEVSGLLFIGSTDNSIFLPYAGAMINKEHRKSQTESTNINYWTSSPIANDNHNAYALTASLSLKVNNCMRYAGFQIRPVAK